VCKEEKKKGRCSMKKFIVVFAALVMVAPLYGDVIFTATDNSDGTCTIAYSCNAGETKGPVGLGLDVDVSSGPAITAVTGVDSFFDVFMDVAWDLEQTGGSGFTYSYQNPQGSPVAKKTEQGEESLPSSSFALSMCGLGGETYGSLDNSPTSATVAILSNSNAGTTNGTISINAIRGGVVEKVAAGENPQMANNLGSPLAFTITPTAEEDCYLGEADEAEWIAVGRPVCWCYPRQCRGDIDGILHGGSGSSGYWRVGTPDIDKLANHFMVLEAGNPVGPSGPGVPGDCSPGNRTP
jgi:hypothetical protein